MNRIGVLFLAMNLDLVISANTMLILNVVNLRSLAIILPTHDLKKDFFLLLKLDLNQFSCLIIFFSLQFVSPSVCDMIGSNQD